MTLQEAIEQLERALADKWCPWSAELKASIRLGIEALKAIKCGREGLRTEFDTPLIGETES